MSSQVPTDRQIDVTHLLQHLSTSHFPSSTPLCDLGITSDILRLRLQLQATYHLLQIPSVDRLSLVRCLLHAQNTVSDPEVQIFPRNMELISIQIGVSSTLIILLVQASLRPLAKANTLLVPSPQKAVFSKSNTPLKQSSSDQQQSV